MSTQRVSIRSVEIESPLSHLHARRTRGTDRPWNLPFLLKWPWPHALASRTDWTTAEMKIASSSSFPLLCPAMSACASSFASAFLCLQSPFIRVNGFHQRKKCISSGRKDRLTRVRGVWQRARPPASPLPALHPSRRRVARFANTKARE